MLLTQVPWFYCTSTTFVFSFFPEPVIGGGQKPHLVQLSGPPVCSAAPSISAIEVSPDTETENSDLSDLSLPQCVAVEVSERVRQQLREIQSSFPDILAQFLDPSTSPPTVPPATPPVVSPAVTPVKPPATNGERERGSSTTTDRSLSIYSAC